ncbi:hypothetical protein GWK47_030709 [Chionoecetes opilio]|uniref:Uncharacterized protein n=1 Tax=Chionoecetes opilio TaxID=41210 RepID=A0A8J4Z1B6_CHIOP|nr:hypothetical protein GWK47_030709 [Chionoecetes opilio]
MSNALATETIEKGRGLASKLPASYYFPSRMTLPLFIYLVCTILIIPHTAEPKKKSCGTALFIIGSRQSMSTNTFTDNKSRKIVCAEWVYPRWWTIAPLASAEIGLDVAAGEGSSTITTGNMAHSDCFDTDVGVLPKPQYQPQPPTT